jgi:hypothetical protein
MDWCDDDPVLIAVKRDAARQEADERKEAQEAHDADVARQFREILLEEFDPELLSILDRSLSPATTAGYAGEFKRFAKWCGELGITPLPAAREFAAVYLGLQFAGGASYGALKRTAAALSYQHQIRNLPDPCPAPDPNDDSDPHDVTSRPFVAAVLRRAREQHKAQKLNEGEQANGKAS